MPINRVVDGDLLKLAEKGHFEVIVHGCNCFHAMGSGIAGQLARKWPMVPKADIDGSERGDRTKLGGFTSAVICSENEVDFTVINAYTQYGFDPKKRPVDYRAIQVVFEKLNARYKGFSIGIPQIGAGLAGGDWDLIENIINEATPDLEITLVMYKP